MPKILVVDDEIVITTQLKERLTGMGYDVVGSASTGEEAVDMARDLAPDIILMDIVMPPGRLDGLDAAKIIRSELDVAVIFLTAFENDDTVGRAKDAEPFGYILKPFQETQVKACIELALHKKEIERRLRESEERDRAELSETKAELSRSARFREEFLANISHEVRTPLHAILGMSEVLQEKVYGTLNDKQIEALHSITAGGHRLLTLMTDILDLTDMRTGNFELKMTPVSVVSIFQESLQQIKPLADKKRLQLAFKFDIDDAATILRADERRLKQVLDNLLDNAVKFTPEGGMIGLDFEGDAQKEAVYFTVWDSGIGIAKADLEQLFQPFVQLDRSLSSGYEGAGLGLALADHIAAMHGGSIAVESEVGQGSRFTVSLPWKERE